jgi:chromosome segregation ATPase
MGWFSNDKELKSKLEAKEEEIKNLQWFIEDLEHTNKDLEHTNKELNSHVNELHSNLNDLRQENIDLRTNNNKVNSELEEAKDKLVKMELDLANKDVELANKSSVCMEQSEFRIKMDKMGRNITERMTNIRMQIGAKDREIIELLDKHSKELESQKVTYEEVIKEYEEVIKELEGRIGDREFLEDCGIYIDSAELFFEYEDSEEYKKHIKKCIECQELMIKLGRACKANTEWIVAGSKAKGEKQNKDNVKLALRLFNLECNEIMYKINTRSNINTVIEKLERSYRTINRLNKVQDVVLQEEYLEAKKLQARLIYEHTMMVAYEKELEAKRREELREQEKVEKEIQKQKEKLLKEKAQYLKEMARLAKQKQQTQDLLDRIAELEAKVNSIDKEADELDEYANVRTRAGWVYIISNDAFDENVYKIGTTRRLDPYERINELGSASVPFKFNVHALMFTEDAFAVENELHKYFNDKRVNKVNNKKEFFKVDLKEIEAKVLEMDGTVEFKYDVHNEDFMKSQLK